MLTYNYLKISHVLEAYLQGYGISVAMSHFLNVLAACVAIALIAILVNFIAKKIIVRIIKHWVDKSTNQYDDIIYEKGVFNKLSHLAPAVTLLYISPVPLAEYASFLKFVLTGVNIYMLVMVLLVVLSFIDALHEMYGLTPTGKQRSIKGYVQVVKTIIYFVGTLMVISILVEKDLSSLFAGLTAFAAVLMFVFKDTILGLIAGIQLSSNDILRVGDYIEMPSKNADGTVIDIKLNTVKVLNANKTICTIPTYAFVAESFWNWRGLDLAEGRRIKRYILLDVSSVKFVDEKSLEKFKNIELLKPFFEQKAAEFSTDEKAIFEGRAFTNSTLFRVYLDAYLRKHPLIITEGHYFAVRHLQPTEHGLPLEIYAYIREKVGMKYEALQADIFDHIMAIANEFGVRLFQEPTGYDVRGGK